MVWAIRVPKSKAEVIRKALLERDLLNQGHSVKRNTDGSLWLPLLIDAAGASSEEVNAELIGRDMSARFGELELKVMSVDLRSKKHNKVSGEGYMSRVPGSLEEALADVLNKTGDCDKLKTAVDIVGDIAVVEIDEGTPSHLWPVLGAAVLRTYVKMKVVLRKDGGHSGAFRIQKYMHIAGENRTLTTCIENTVRLKLDIASTYYSPRSSAERMRVAKLVAKGERVCVMFCGVGPYVCVIAKLSECASVMGVEMNKTAAAFAKENIRKNRVDEICSIKVGDVREIFPSKLGPAGDGSYGCTDGCGCDLLAYNKQDTTSSNTTQPWDTKVHLCQSKLFDRIVMPMPHTGDDFLDVALPMVSQTGGWLHVYYFSGDVEVNKFKQELPAIGMKYGRRLIPNSPHRCGNLGPKTYRWCVDIRVLPL
eukprot:CFRG1723T1